MTYEEFIKERITIKSQTDSIHVEKKDLNPNLFEFQKDIVRWALAKGRAAIFASCGTGKTICQLEWAHHVQKHTEKPVIILAPLAVSTQTVHEGEKFGIDVTLCNTADDVNYNGINVTNYEKLDKFPDIDWGGVVLDESSILKSFTGKVRGQIIDNFCMTPFRLACTATPAPNDYMELGNHSEFLGIMSYSEMLSMFFVHDGGETSKWRLKGHAEKVFWEWLSSFCVFVDNPKDIGYDQSGYDLPPMHTIDCCIDKGITEEPAPGSMTLTDRRNAKRESIESKVSYIMEFLKDKGILTKRDGVTRDKYIIWCDLNKEQDTIAHALGENCVSIQGSTPNDKKISLLHDWMETDIPVMVTKAQMFGYGLNLQICHNMIFFGLNDSYEQYYQAVRRCWRFGQPEEVNVYIVTTVKEGAIQENIQRKQADHEKMRAAMVAHTKEITAKELRGTYRIMTEYHPDKPMRLPKWAEFGFKTAV